jgi:hypothetical protein
MIKVVAPNMALRVIDLGHPGARRGRRQSGHFSGGGAGHRPGASVWPMARTRST